MKLFTLHHGKIALASSAIALLVASCGTGNGDNGSATGHSGSSGSLVSVKSVDGTDVLTDADGRTLYSADVEKGGQIRCVDTCTSFWQPVQASAADVSAAHSELGAELGVVKRPDGESQLTYDKLPLYTFAQEGAGELKGNGFTDDFQGTHFTWLAATTDQSSAPAGTPSSEAPDNSGGGYGY